MFYYFFLLVKKRGGVEKNNHLSSSLYFSISKDASLFDEGEYGSNDVK
jgi:hypothetical protein